MNFFIVDHPHDLQCCKRFYDQNAKGKNTIFIDKPSEDKNVNKMYVHTYQSLVIYDH